MDHKSKILDCYLDLLKTKDKVPFDVSFLVGSTNQEKIGCHKLFLIAQSPVFEAMFADRWASGSGSAGSGDVIQLPDVEPQVFRMFLEYLYAGKTSETESFDGVDDDDDISGMGMLLYVAEKYQVSHMVKQFEEILLSKLKIPNAIQIHALAGRHRLDDLRKSAREFMARKFSNLMEDPSFGTMDPKLLEFCVLNRDSDVTETEIFEGLVKWSEFRCVEAGLETSGPNKRKMLGAILDLVEFTDMTIAEFETIVVPSNILTDEEKLTFCEDMVHILIIDQVMPEIPDSEILSDEDEDL